MIVLKIKYCISEYFSIKSKVEKQVSEPLAVQNFKAPSVEKSMSQKSWKKKGFYTVLGIFYRNLWLNSIKMLSSFLLIFR
jgi:hypothetical protein